MGRRSQSVRDRQIEREQRARARADREAAGRERGCLFCRKSDGGFTTVEHVFPESLGNTTVVLENGIVCDRCNNTTLSELDQVICEFMPVKARRTMLGVPSKAGKLPVTRFSTATLRNLGESRLYVQLNGPNDMTTVREIPRDDGHVELKLEVKGGSRLTPRYCSKVSRALLKSAFECAWLDHGEALLDARFDHVREAVLGKPREGFIAIGKKGNPEHYNVTLSYGLVPTSTTERVVAMAHYFGVPLLTDSGLAKPGIDTPDDVILVEFTT